MDFPIPPQEHITHDNVGKKYHRDTSAKPHNCLVNPTTWQQGSQKIDKTIWNQLNSFNVRMSS